MVSKIDAVEPAADAEEEREEETPHPAQMRPWAEVGPAPRKCQWLIGDARKRNFCGDPTKPGSSYCKPHHEKAYYRVRLVRRPGGGAAAAPVPDDLAAE